MQHCIAGFCFVALDPGGPKFFGFSEFLAALALMVLVWTTTDTRYRFRIETAPVPLYTPTYAIIAAVGVATLLTDLWRAEGWLVPAGRLVSPGAWQAMMGGLFLFTFLSWGWFAYVRPPRFGSRNAQRFLMAFYRRVVDGSSPELAILAGELVRSIPTLIEAAPNHRRLGGRMADEPEPQFTRLQAIADDLLLLLGDARFCRVLVASAPGVIVRMFQEMNAQQKFGLSVCQFGRNLTQAAIEDPNSFLYHEEAGYVSGLLGYLKPVSQSLYGNARMAEEIGTLLDVSFREQRRWSVREWQAYQRAVLIVAKDYVKTDFWNHSFILFRAFGTLSTASSDLGKLNATDSAWDDDIRQRLDASVDFCNRLIQILEERGVPKGLRRRIRKGDPIAFTGIYDWLVDLMFDIIKHGTAVKEPVSLCWSVQHNAIWGEFFGQLEDPGPARKIIQFKLRRKIYNEAISALRFPNYVNAPLVGYCLNVLGFKIHEDVGRIGRDSRALHKALLVWTRRHYAALEQQSPHVMEDSLPAALSYDKAGRRLVKIYEANAFHSEPHHIYFPLDPSLVGSERVETV